MRNTTILMMIAVTLGFSGCKSNSGDKAQLTANEWQLKEMITTKGKTTLSQRVPTLMLTDTNTMYGFSGCNRFFGRYTTEGNTIKLEPGGSTMMACPDLQFEHEYIQTLAAKTTNNKENKEKKDFLTPFALHWNIQTARKSFIYGLFRNLVRYSNSIVPGGLLVKS